jgi:TRAP-type C4-dicarboxylate transport system permease small subunit
MQRAENAYGRLLEVLALVGCALVLGMMLIICADVFLRNVRILPGTVGLAWANDLTEAGLYLTTMLAAPWLLRRGQHIRVDIVLRAIPKRAAWVCEWLADLLALLCCLVMVAYGARMAWASYKSGAMTIKTLITPEWWLLAPLPAAFTLLAVEMLFRMRRLLHAERGPRDDAVTAA